jgi:hypothetical protein
MMYRLCYLIAASGRPTPVDAIALILWSADDFRVVMVNNSGGRVHECVCPGRVMSVHAMVLLVMEYGLELIG